MNGSKARLEDQKILVCTHAYPPDTGGIAAFTRDIRELLKNAGSRVAVFKGKTGKRTNSRMGSYLSVGKMFSKLFGMIRDFRPDVVFCSRLLPLGPLVLLGARLFNYRVVIQVHGTELRHRFKEGWRKQFLKRMYNQADQIWANSRYTSNLLKDFGCDPHRIKIIYPFLTRDAQRLASRVNGHQTNGHFTLMTAAALYPRKGIDLVMRALAKLEHFDWEYRIAGEPYNSHYEGMYERLAEQLGISKRVKFLGQLERSSLWKEMAHADLFVMPSRGLEDDIESFGIVFIEAQQFGVPCIGSDVGGINEAIGNAGIIIEDENIDELTQSIKHLINSPRERNRLSNYALERIDERFVEQSRHEDIQQAFAELQL